MCDRMANQKYDESFRLQIETDYITNYDATLRGLARIYGVSESSLKDWKSKGSWDTKREEHKNQVVGTVQNDIAEKQSEKLTKIHNVAVGAVEYWLSMYDPETQEGKNRLANATTGEMKLIKELMQASGMGQSISGKTVNFIQNNIENMSKEDLEKARDKYSSMMDI